MDTGEGVKFPALSVQPPLTAAAAWSGPVYVTAEQAAMPEVASAPFHATPIGWLNQPLKSAPRASTGATPVGGSASILTVMLLLACSGPSVAEHVDV